MRLTFACALLATLMLVAGCGGTGSRVVHFEPQEKLLDYEHDFSEAYMAPSEAGGFDLVLTSGFAPVSPRQGQVVRPAAYEPMRQIMHIHVTWRPARGSRSDFPAATNASIRYHVFTGDSPVTASRVSYSGAGFVTLDLGGSSSQVAIRDALIRPQERTGNARDPIGPARLTGFIVARNDGTRVQALLERLEEALGETTPDRRATHE